MKVFSLVAYLCVEPVGGGISKSQTFASLLVCAFLRGTVQHRILGCCLLATQINTKKKVDPLQSGSAGSLIHSVRDRD